ncbi:bifunctional lysylphosphatidylglycerol flippase/synthetase MprF [Rhodobacter lacus]|uniref:Phosphatidylglycerol lysyltransferase n=1 Tax=Rhodobacter lacus TaxID=1641972 RepID=A0ABW5ADC2_9RHOB
MSSSATASALPQDGNAPCPTPQTEAFTQERPTIWTRLARIQGLLAALAMLAVFALMVWSILRLTSEVRYDDVLAQMQTLHPWSIGLALLFTALSFAALAFYDANALDYIGRRLPLLVVSLTSFLAYAIGNTIGFGALSGGAIRFRAYSKLGLDPGEVAQVVAFVTLAFGMGLMLMAGISTLIVAPQIARAIGWDPVALRVLAVTVLAALALLQAFGGRARGVRLAGITLHLPDTRTASRQVLVSALDMAASASVLYVLMPGLDVSWPGFFAIYCVAVGVGIISHVPAGLGVFEAVMLAGLQQSAGADSLLGALIVYRVIYHGLPLTLALVLLVVTELRRFGQTALAVQLGQSMARLAPSILSAFALIVAAMLVFSGATPVSEGAMNYLSARLPLPIIEAAHFLSSLLGLVLFVAARGLGQRLDGAWLVAVLAAALALVLSLPKSVALVQASVLALFVIALLMNRRAFNRHASLTRQVLGVNWLAAMTVLIGASVAIMVFVYRDTGYSHALWWQFEFEQDVPRSLRALLGLMIAALAIATWSLLRPVASRPALPTVAEIDRATAIVRGQDIADANLVRMGDKPLLFSASGRSFLMYGVQGRSWIALLDPVGDAQDFPELVWRFIETAAACGGRAVFYQISPALLSACADAGLRAYKMGECALIDLAGFTLSGRRNAGHRAAWNRGQREGLDFAMIPPEDVPAVMADLHRVSQAWLAQHAAREKRFSLGAFDPAYVAAQPVAVLRKAGEIIAFATVAVTETKAEATVDLMRFAPDAPDGTMDYLFLCLFEHLRAEGFARFNLGMAPLAGLTRHELAPVWDHLGAVLFEHGERFYNFRGLRAFKAKFHPRWEPRYLAVAGPAGAALALMDAALLIGGGMRGVIGK